MRARDVGWIVGYGIVLLVSTWVVATACVRAGWIVPPGETQPIRYSGP